MTVSSARPQKTPDPADVYAGQVLRALRKKQGLSQEKLADALGVTFQQLQKYERAANRISVSKLDKIARILDVSPALFFDCANSPLAATAGKEKS
ncbi:MAG: helix-turn-helix transcriptional regulator, partial [Alphaproteobacteria bacterium]|nr:helix-turn-helix transcriptional regulator [Alphaproteobacteria bacterium]